MNILSKLQLVIDADVILYQSTVVVEHEVDWGNDHWTLHSSLEDGKREFIQRIQSITKKCLEALKHDGDYDITMCLSDSKNFRKDILESYKSNRKGQRKPLCYVPLKQWVTENYTTVCYDNTEGDDACGILGTSLDNVVLLSLDKDFKTLPCRFYDFNKEELYNTTPQEAEYNMYYQCLCGDVTDGYKGLPGCGDKGAKKILDTECSWNAVLSAYLAKGYTEDEALTQLRVARILHSSDYDTKTGEIKLWCPSIPMPNNDTL